LKPGVTKTQQQFDNLNICGNDASAKREVSDRLCEWFGWKAGNIIDLGDLEIGN